MEYEFKPDEIEMQKTKAFKKDISNIKSFTKKLNDMYDTEFNEAFKRYF